MGVRASAYVECQSRPSGDVRLRLHPCQDVTDDDATGNDDAASAEGGVRYVEEQELVVMIQVEFDLYYYY